jgi:hypothetical protein
VRDPLESWKKRHPEKKKKNLFLEGRRATGNVTCLEWLVCLAIASILLSYIAIPVFLIVMYFVSPPVNYEDYEADRKQRIEQVEKIKDSF